MRILYISQYFPPETNAPASRVSELARAWKRRGHDVTVLTAFPHHPTGVIPERYRGKKFLRENADGVEVVRTWIYATPNEGFVKRTASYMSFMTSAVLLGRPALAGKFDAVIATSPQFFTAIAGWIIAATTRSPFVFEVRDLWPASIVAVGAIKNRAVIKTLEWMEMFLYRRAKLIVAVADSTVEILAKRGVPRERIAVIKNGVDLALFTPGGRGEAVRAEWGLEGKFVCSYIGTIGMAHALEVMLDAAERTRGDAGVAYLIVGAGARYEELKAEAARRGLASVVFAGPQPRERMPEFLAASDAVLVHLRKTELFEHVIPSKIFETMAMARPIIMGVRGEAGALVEAAGGGLAMEPENGEDLARAIARLRSEPALGKSLGESGRAYVMEHFDREVLAERYLEHLKNLPAGKRPDSTAQATRA